MQSNGNYSHKCSFSMYLTCLALARASENAGLGFAAASELAEDPGGKSLILHP